MMEKLNIKKEKIVDIQEAMKKGDLNNDGILDFDEWRHTMKMYDIHRTYLLPCLFIGVTPGVWGSLPPYFGLGRSWGLHYDVIISYNVRTGIYFPKW